MKKKVQLVLGSGGARGIAHIGVIERLLEDGFEITEVAGSSMGAVVGGMYCSGKLSVYRDWLKAQSKKDIYRLFDITFSLKGLIKGERIFDELQRLTGEQLIENLPIPFVAVATDILNRAEVHFTKGDLYKALRASTGLPGVFTPVATDGPLYIDGGVLKHLLPLDLLEPKPTAITVGVSLNGAFQNEIVAEEAQQDMEQKTAFFTKLSRHFSLFSIDEKKAGEITEVPTLTMFEMLSASYDATVDKIVEKSILLNPPDVLIEIPRNACSVFEFHRAAELIELGRAAYDKAITPQKQDIEN